MKLLLYSDNHWSQYSSIIRKRGVKYSQRLENQVKSLNWAMQLAAEKDCSATICLGDFFDKAELNCEELSALKEIRWANMTNYFIAGNHEMGLSNHDYSSSKLFSLLDTGIVITEPTTIRINDFTEICILPYILESNRLSLKEYFGDYSFPGKGKRVILSHNDIQGIRYGGFLSTIGFSIDEINNNCDLFINGHLHNGDRIDDKIFNIGNLTGQNFSEDATSYDHCAFILNTDTLKIEVYENPYAFNFYKIESDKNIYPNIKDNSVVTFKCSSVEAEKWKETFDKDPRIIESRIIITRNILTQDSDGPNIEDLSVDHLKEFTEFIKMKLETSDVVLSELAEVCK